MAARKKSSRGRKKVARKSRRKGATARRAKSALDRVSDELPVDLRDYAKKIQGQLNALEREIEQAIPQTRRQLARLIREASHQLGVWEMRGEKAWRQRADRLTRDAQKLLRKLEKAVAPSPAKRSSGKRKKTAKKKAKKSAKKAVKKKAKKSVKKKRAHRSTKKVAKRPSKKPASKPPAADPSMVASVSSRTPSNAATEGQTAAAAAISPIV